MHTTPSPGVTLATPIDPAEVRTQLKRIVESPFFRGTRRCRVFLEQVVEHSLAPASEPLKERTLGVTVFGREPTYDTAADPIVRVTAAEVRRRLGQYYADEAHHAELRIDLPAGSYAPICAWPHPTRSSALHAEPAASGPLVTRSYVGLVLTLALMVSFAGFVATRGAAGRTAFDAFWAPFFQAPAPALLCPGGLDMYELPWQLKEASRQAAAQESDSPLLISPRDVQQIGVRYLAVSDAVALARLAALFQERRLPYRIQETGVTSFADLRASPAVLLGMFSNGWTLQLGQGLRFVPEIEGDGHHVTIRDRHDPERSWRLPRPWPSLAVPRDYALVSRVVDPDTGTFVVSVGGITPFGTTAAVELVTSPAHLHRVLEQLGAWSGRNLQLVLETPVIDGAAGVPRVLAAHVW